MAPVSASDLRMRRSVAMVACSELSIGSFGGMPSAKGFVMRCRVDVVDYHEERCEHMMADFIEKNPSLWNEDIGE